MAITPALPTPAPASPAITSFRGPHAFLSSFALVPGGVQYRGLVGPTVEHVFQAAKTPVLSEQRAVLAASGPQRARTLGRSVTLRENWDTVKLGIMVALVRAKFNEPSMHAALAATGDAALVEGNHWCDAFWGVCTCPRHSTDGSTAHGTGQNWLGQILTLNRSLTWALGS